jgi:type I restriction enzyme S subunit
LFDIKTDKLLPDFLRVLLNTEILQSQIKAKGSTNYSAVRPGDVLNWEIPLPGINEQRIIAKHYLKTKGKSVLLEKEYDRQNKLISQLRQALLKKAVEGTLMPQDPNDEPASKLLEGIKAEKKILIKEGKLKSDKPLIPIKPEEIPFAIPGNWVWCKLGDITTKIGSGSTPRGGDYSTSGIPFFRSQNIYNSGLQYDDIKLISTELHKKMLGTQVSANDLLLNITGGSLGRCAKTPNNFNVGNVSQHVCIIRTFRVDADYFHKLILSPYFQYMIFSSTTGAGREGLPKYNLENFLIPLPPLLEQYRILTKLNKLMEYCDSLEKQINQSISQANLLTQSVLLEALQPEEVEN